jgi:4-hydroxybenzoate polyprenyltransferase
MVDNVTPPELSPRQRAAYTVVEMARTSEWWAYKFAPVLATAYATAALGRASLWPLLPLLLLLLLSLTVGAVYVSLLNDWTDRADDAASQKANRLAHKSGAFVAGALGLCLGAGLAFGYYFWQVSPAASLLYLGAWLAYSLYSLPPFRLKKRGFWGVLADAGGAHFFPQLLTALLLSYWSTGRASGWWLLAVGGWALGCGIRNIMWHQLGDEAHDAEAGVATFVTLRGRAVAKRVAAWLAFPLEVAAFALLLGLSQLLLPLALLAFYAGLEWFRHRVWNVHLVVAEPEPNHRILLNEYYEVFYPLAFLLVQTSRYPADGLVLGLHLLLFGRHLWRSVQSIGLVLAALRHKLMHHPR